MKIQMTEEERKAQLAYSCRGMMKCGAEMREAYLTLKAWEHYNKLVKDGTVPLSPRKRKYAKLAEENAYLWLASVASSALVFQERIATCDPDYKAYMAELRLCYGRYRK